MITPNSSCLGSARANLALRLGVDAVGVAAAFIPGGTALSVVANGSVAAAGFGLAAMDLPQDPSGAGTGALMGIGGVVGWRGAETAARASVTAGKFVPVVGALFSGASIWLDVQQYQQAKNAYLAGVS